MAFQEVDLLEKESFKKRQEDAKKKQTGELPPDLDQDGKMINPHNPDFITKVPWYLGESGPTLKHHNVQKVDHYLSLNESDLLIKQKIATQLIQNKEKKLFYRKGACKNCGAMTHKEKDCVERPRSKEKSAWKTGVSLAPDEVVLELEKHGKVSYDAKRDQWQGYDPSDYKSTVDRFARLEQERKKYKQEEKELLKLKEEEEKKIKLEKKQQKKKLDPATTNSTSATTTPTTTTTTSETSGVTEDSAAVMSDGDGGEGEGNEGEGSDVNENESLESDSGSDYDSDENEDEGDDTKEFLQRDENARDFQSRHSRQGGVGGAQMKTTVRNLRQREDTPKYLRNLDLNSAFYDPKSRSMRNNPLPNENPENLAYAGDNFIRYTGDAIALAQSQILCWEMQARGEDIDVVSNPSQLEMVKKQYLEKKKVLEESKKKELLDKYGVDPATLQQTLDPRLKLGQTEIYSEYSHDGRLVTTNGVKIVTKTKYEEDVYYGNHTSVWGSFYNRRKSCWGYACCHSTHKNSYCTGEKGKMYNDGESLPTTITSNIIASSSSSTSSSTATGTGTATAGHSNSSSSSSSTTAAAAVTSSHEPIHKRSDLYGECSNPHDSSLFDEKKVQDAMKKLTNQSKLDSADPSQGHGHGKKRGYNSMTTADVTPEEMEAYRRIKVQREDPMAKFLLNNENDELLE